MVQTFKVQQNGIPVNFEIEGQDGATKTIELFVSLDENNAVAMLKRVKGIKSNAADIATKYPKILNDDFGDDPSDEDIAAMQELLTAVDGPLQESYDSVFGDGTYKKLRDAGMSRLDLMQQLPAVSDFLATEIDKRNAQADKVSKQHIDKYLHRSGKK